MQPLPPLSAIQSSPHWMHRLWSGIDTGGIVACFDGRLHTKFIREGRDPYGCWIWHEFGENNRITRIYAVYRVCEGSENISGYSTAWFQQRLQLQRDVIEINPRKHIVDSLLQDVIKHISDGQNVIILGDFNEGIYGPERMSDKFKEAGLFNMMEKHLDTTSLPRTQSRGSKAIDHIWATRHIIDNVTRAVYAPFNHLMESGHRGLFFDIPEDALFGADSLKVVYHKYRRLKSTIPTRTLKYMKTLSKDWEYHKIDQKFETIRDLFNSDILKERLSQVLNQLDGKVTEIMVHAEKNALKSPPITWIIGAPN